MTETCTLNLKDIYHLWDGVYLSRSDVKMKCTTLKEKRYLILLRNVTLKKLLADVAGDYVIKTNYDAELGAVRYSSKTVAQIFDDIRKKTNLHCYFVAKTLYCGNVYSEKVQTEK